MLQVYGCKQHSGKLDKVSVSPERTVNRLFSGKEGCQMVTFLKVLLVLKPGNQPQDTFLFIRVFLGIVHQCLTVFSLTSMFTDLSPP